MTTEGFEPSARIGEKAFDGMKESASEIWATDCPLAGLQIRQGTGRTAKHPVQILAEAYGLSDQGIG